MGWKCLNVSPKHCVNTRPKKTRKRKMRLEDSLSSSSSEDEKPPCKLTQIFIGDPADFDITSSRETTQKEWCDKNKVKDLEKMRQEEEVQDNGSADLRTMTHEEWCSKYCPGGRTISHRPPQQTPYSQKPPQPQIVSLPMLNHCCCSLTSDKRKKKKEEEPMTPVQQYMTFLQGYALAAAVMMAGPPPRAMGGEVNKNSPSRNFNQSQFQDYPAYCRICP